MTKAVQSSSSRSAQNHNSSDSSSRSAQKHISVPDYTLLVIELRKQDIFVELEATTRVRATARLVDGEPRLLTMDGGSIPVERAMSEQEIEDLVYLLERKNARA